MLTAVFELGGAAKGSLDVGCDGLDIILFTPFFDATDGELRQRRRLHRRLLLRSHCLGARARPMRPAITIIAIMLTGTQTPLMLPM